MSKKKKLTEVEKRIKEIPIPTINYNRGEKQVSYSQFSTYMKCPFQWYLTYGLKYYEDKPSIHTIFGTAIHETLQHYFQKMYNESGAAADREDIITFFEDKLIEEYKKNKNRKDEHFSTPEELREFNEDGIKILNWFKKHRNEYFTTRNCKLLGIEMPLIQNIGKDLYFKGLIDIAIYDIDLDKIFIIDFKTSTYGWKDKEKKDELKVSQILLYKKYFSQQYDIDIDKVEVEFIILKRKIWEESEFPIPRIQVFRPSSGKISLNKVKNKFEQFLEECYNGEGKPILDKIYYKTIGEDSCKYCPYSQNSELCNKQNI